jgi:hypothetical protein
MQKSRIVTRGFSGGEMSSRGRFTERTTPAGFPLHDCSLYRELHVPRESLGFVRRLGTIFCCPVPNPDIKIRHLFIADSTRDARES